MPFEIRVRGQAAVEARLAQFARDSAEAAQQALREEAEVEMTEAKKRTPVRTGALRASGRVEDIPGAEVGVRLLFGGAAVTYAVPVHENLSAFHRVGQAKYLESVLAESMPHLADRIARRMREILGS